VTEPLETRIHYRLERAQESLDDARLLADADRWNACVNRLYYSCFYAVSALLVRDGLSSSRHTGVRSLLSPPSYRRYSARKPPSTTSSVPVI
jgi:uncharacterized protein (UPF0332 family)